MFSRHRLCRCLIGCFLVAFLMPRTAESQWYAGIYVGGNYTHPASVTIDQPDLGRSVRFDAVEFEGRPFESPQYYGWRLGRLFGQGRRLGIELEFIHLKVIAETERTYRVTGTDFGEPGTPLVMRTIVQRYAMTHGLNFVVVNFVSRTPLGQSPFALVLRSGVGPTIPHAESTIDNEPREQYEHGGLGTHLSAGVDIGRWRFFSATAEYKFTLTRPVIDVAHGTGRTTAATHQFAAGLAFGRAR